MTDKGHIVENHSDEHQKDVPPSGEQNPPAAGNSRISRRTPSSQRSPRSKRTPSPRRGHRSRRTPSPGRSHRSRRTPSSRRSPRRSPSINWMQMALQYQKKVCRYVQWLLKIFGHFSKSHNFFKINPNDLSFFEKLEGLVYQAICFVVLEEIAIDRNSEENSEDRFLNFFCDPATKIQKTRL